eukprot:2651749-Pyramimonas_sp.AAC.2
MGRWGHIHSIAATAWAVVSVQELLLAGLVQFNCEKVGDAEAGGRGQRRGGMSPVPRGASLGDEPVREGRESSIDHAQADQRRVDAAEGRAHAELCALRHVEEEPSLT